MSFASRQCVVCQREIGVDDLRWRISVDGGPWTHFCTDCINKAAGTDFHSWCIWNQVFGSDSWRTCLFCAQHDDEGEGLTRYRFYMGKLGGDWKSQKWLTWRFCADCTEKFVGTNFIEKHLEAQP